jgi:hypothetical protein
MRDSPIVSGKEKGVRMEEDVEVDGESAGEKHGAFN